MPWPSTVDGKSRNISNKNSNRSHNSSHSQGLPWWATHRILWGRGTSNLRTLGRRRTTRVRGTKSSRAMSHRSPRSRNLGHNRLIRGTLAPIQIRINLTAWNAACAPMIVNGTANTSTRGQKTSRSLFAIGTAATTTNGETWCLFQDSNGRFQKGARRCARRRTKAW